MSEAKPTPLVFIYDFDGTLAPGEMQEHSFIPAVGMKSRAFWKQSNDLAREAHGDRILLYMHLMLQEAIAHQLSRSREAFHEYGKGIKFFPGVEAWFQRINREGEKRGLAVKHYVISSGLLEMIEGTRIYPEFEKVFASTFLYDADGVAVGPALAINYTTKTQFLFRINKGALDLADDATVNAYIPKQDRAVPFENMVYIGDGSTDIPCFRLVREQGGTSVAVYDPAKPTLEGRAQKLIGEQRVDFVTAADYGKGSPLDAFMGAVMDAVAARARQRTLARQTRRKRTPG